MTQPRFESMSSAQLEELLRRKDLSLEDRRAVQAELGRRISGNLTATPPAVGPPPPPKAPGPTSYAAHQPTAHRPPRAHRPQRPMPASPPPAAPPPYGQSPVPHPFPGNAGPRKSVAGKVIVVLAIVAALVAVVVYFLVSSGDDDTPTPSETGYTCFVSSGSCPLAQGLPVGTSCECVDDFGGTYVGTVG